LLQAGMATLRQLYFGKLDMDLHSLSSLSSSLPLPPPVEVQRGLARRGFTLLEPLPEDRLLCSFSHIFAGGYAAGYYSYLWAEVRAWRFARCVVAPRCLHCVV
jgi:oligopeptidase A